jgi:hypothetical protein
VLTILQQQSKTLAFVSLLVLNNKFSSQDETTSGLYILYPFSKYPSFPRSVTGYRDAASRQEQTSHHYHYQRAQDNSTAATTRQHDTGSSADSMCRAYSTSPNLPRSGTLPNQIKVPHGTVCTRRTRGQTWYRPAGGTAAPQILIPTSGCFRLLLKPSAHTHSGHLRFARLSL